MNADSSFLSAPLRALTIAGFDPSGAAGVLADVKTFCEFGLESSAAITSVTFQNTTHGFGKIDQTAESLRRQILPLLDEFTFVCAKTGMLPTSEVVIEVARLFRETKLPRPVVDPVIISSAGQRLMEETAIETFINELLPLASLVTPNIPEAEALTGIAIASETDMRRAATALREMGASAVLIKGGHLRGPTADGRRHTASDRRQVEDNQDVAFATEALDVLDNEGLVTVFREQRIAGPGIRGSGCILSAAIAAGVGQGKTLEEAVAAAKSFISNKIRAAATR